MTEHIDLEKRIAEAFPGRKVVVITQSGYGLQIYKFGLDSTHDAVGLIECARIVTRVDFSRDIRFKENRPTPTGPNKGGVK